MLMLSALMPNPIIHISINCSTTCLIAKGFSTITYLIGALHAMQKMVQAICLDSVSKITARAARRKVVPEANDWYCVGGMVS